MAGMVAAVPVAAQTQALAPCTRLPAPATVEEESTLRIDGPAAKRCRISVLPALVGTNPERRAGHTAAPARPPAAAPGRPPRQPAGACPLRQRQAAQGQAPLSAQLLARLPRAPAAALLQRHPLLRRLCSLLDSWATLSREVGIPTQLHLPPAVLVEAAAWLLQLGTRSQAVLAGRPQELCLVVAAAASANQQLHEQLARTMLLLKGMEDHVVAQGAHQAQQQQPQKSCTGRPGEPASAAAAPTPSEACLREIRTQLRARCWEHLQVQQPEVAERLLSKLAARHVQQQRQTAERVQPVQGARAAKQHQAFEAHVKPAKACLLPAPPAQPLEPASSSSDEPSASTASTASLEQQPQRESQEQDSPATPVSATSAATDRTALTPLERRVLQLLRSDASVAARLESFLLAEPAAPAAGPAATSAGTARHKRKSPPGQTVG